MIWSRRSNRPQGSSRWSIRRKMASAVGALARRAGRAEESSFEALEARQLLFVLEVPPDPSGFGTVATTFGYVLPYLIPTTQIQNQQGTPVLEDFNEADPLPTPVPQGGTPVADGYIFNGSNFRIDYLTQTSNTPDDPALPFPGPYFAVTPPRLRPTAGGQGQENELFITLGERQYIDLHISVSNVGQGANIFIGVQNLRFDTSVFLGLTGTTAQLISAGSGAGVPTVIETFSGTALDALATGALPNLTYNFQATSGARFDTIRLFRGPGVASGGFKIDNVATTAPGGQFGQYTDSRVRGVSVVFSAPSGTQIEFLDLYGRQMIETIALGIPQNATYPVAIVDPEDDGVPNYNDGIGRINIRGVDDATALELMKSASLTIFGGDVESGQPTPEAEFSEGGFNFLLGGSVLGSFDEFESVGFGYQITIPPGGGQPRVTGLPPGAGSVVIGSPFVRNNSTTATYNAAGSAIIGLSVTSGFTIADQGIFIQGTAHPLGDPDPNPSLRVPFSSVNIHGIVFGSSVFSSSVDRINIGSMMGSVAVAGDLGQAIFSGDAGLWMDDDGTPIVRTGGQLSVGRTLGEFATGGRNLMNVTVLGDVNNPVTRPARDVLRHIENEAVIPFLAGTQPTVEDVIKANLARNGQIQFDKFLAGFGQQFTSFGQTPFFGSSSYRNDTVLSAEWIGSGASEVLIFGALGDPGDGLISPLDTLRDPSDVYGFAADGRTDIVVQFDTAFTGGFGFNIRLVDQSGRTVAANQVPDFGDPRQRSLISTLQFKYRPEVAGAYYLVVQTTASGAADYLLKVSGMAPTTFGSYRTAAGSGRNTTGFSNTISVLAGSMGAMRVGTGFINGGGQDTDPAAVMNIGGNGTIDDTADEYMAIRGMTVSVFGSLYAITAGSDIQDVAIGTPFRVNVGGDLGTITTGLSGIVGTGPTQGDFRDTILTVGGSIAFLDIRGALGIDQDAVGDVKPSDPPQTVVIRTGQDPTRRGDIGMIRVGSHSGGDVLQVSTPNGSTIGGYLIDQDFQVDATRPDIGIYGNAGTGGLFNLGSNSDYRFFDVPQVDLLNLENAFIPLIPGAAPVLITDDGGGQVNIRIVGGGSTGGLIRVIPVRGSQGVVIGRIEVDLSGGAQLEINAVGTLNNNDVISIGRIEITGSTAASSIAIIGNTQVDVWRIIQTGGTAFNRIDNNTPFGDIVSIDVAALNNLTIRTGDLGRTQVSAAGPQLLGPFLGVGGQGGGMAGDPIPIPANTMTGFWNGGLYRPANNSVGTNSWLDDVGSPVDPYLNGIIVRTGNVALVQVGGAIGDVIVPAGNLTNVVANFDMETPVGRFDGIVGSIYANNIQRVDIGDGLAPRDPSPLSTTGIFANNDINLVTGTRIPGANIRSTILAANNVIAIPTQQFPANGINRIELREGSFIDAFIGSMNLDQFWQSTFSADAGFYAGVVNQIRGDAGTNLFRSTISAFGLTDLTLMDGFYDASTTTVGGSVTRIEAQGFRNSTLGGGELEFRSNQILVGGDVGTLTTSTMMGDISDIAIDILGRLGEISARTLARSTVEADLGIDRMMLEQDIRGSTVNAGFITMLDVKNSVRSSAFSVSGLIDMFTVGNEITNTDIAANGPDGRINTIKAKNLISGSIFSAGPIDTVESTDGDIVITVNTITNQRGIAGDINTLKAGRDLDVKGFVQGNVKDLIAGRNFGNRFAQAVLTIRGDLTGEVDVSNGQLYNDIRVGSTFSAAVTIGSAVNKPGNSALGRGSLIAYGRIADVTIEGDFGGDIISYTGGIGVVTINNGSLLASSLIAAYDGNLNNIVINNGHLFGAVHADYILFSIRLNGSNDGVFGDIGVNPDLNQGVSADANRNQLPPGVIANTTIQGPRITAGFNIGRIVLTNGSIFESFIYAGRAIGTIDVVGDIRNDNQTTGTGTVIAAGSSIFTVRASGNIADTLVLAGILSFGDDLSPGGTDPADADTVQSGRITTVRADGSMSRVRVSAGMTPGADNVYGTGDERVALGISYIREVTAGGSVIDTAAFADSPTLTTSVGVMKFGTNFPLADTDLNSGAAVGTQLTEGFVFNFTHNGVSGNIVYTGPGTVYWDAAAGKVRLVNTKLTTTLTVNAPATLTNFDISTNDDASMGQITVNANLAGDSDIAVDAYGSGLNIGSYDGTGTIKFGMNVRSIVTGNFRGGTIQAAFWARSIFIGGNFEQGATMNLLAGETIGVGGNLSSLVNVERDLSNLNVTGAMSRGRFRTGASLGNFTAGSVSESRFSVTDTLGGVTINGSVLDTSIQVGGDLGSDAQPGGTGLNADRVTSGFVGDVTITGDFLESDLVAGSLRGPDGFFGTADDAVAAGRSTLGDVTIDGSQVGSTLASETFAISATGAIGQVSIGGNGAQSQGNFEFGQIDTNVLPIQVVDLIAGPEAGIWIATLFFNQSIDESTIAAALTISEVRNNGLTFVPLVQGTDYIVEGFNAADNSVRISFSRTVTDRDLLPASGQTPPATQPGTQDPALPGPGVFRFIFDANVLRASTSDARLDGNSDGFARPNENYSQDAVIGDAGDKYTAEVNHLFDTLGNPSYRVDYYAPADLDLVLDGNATPDGLPDVNRPYTIRGVVGDHQDNDINFFGVAGDADIYKITLQAGQILRLGAMQGSALFAGAGLFQFGAFAAPFLYNGNGQIQGGTTGDTFQLPVDAPDNVDFTQAKNFLVKTTGTYFIVVANDSDFETPGAVPQVEITSGNTGDYRFTVEVFDDGDSGFSAGTISGNGTNVVNAPAPIVFAGPNGVFQDPSDPTYDDLSSITIGEFIFTIDDTKTTVVGGNGNGIFSTRSGSLIQSTIESAIGPIGRSGQPGDLAADVDIYHLNNRQSIPTGTPITITVKLAELGSDLGSVSQDSFTDFTGSVQFALFDTTNSTGIDDGILVFSPKEFRPIAGNPNTTLASDSQTTYGFDANGDFFITFLAPGQIGGSGDASYAVYLQGAFNTDYVIQVTQGDSVTGALTQSNQNFFIETRGGKVNWLELGGLTTNLDAFTSGVLGFTGSIGGQPVDQYILTRAVAALNQIFVANGLNVRFSTDPNEFEFQDHSTIYLTATNDPKTVFNAGNLGYSQRSDPFNTDKNDEAVVFAPSLSTLTYVPSIPDADRLALSIAAAIGRRAGELMGLRITSTSSIFDNPIDIMSSNSVNNVPSTTGGQVYAYPNVSQFSSARALNDASARIVDTNFFLGRQDAFGLLDKFLTP
ncbi:MAG: beta strand repeat-containing protein [Phycisphaerales bacterium]